jgi:hypothetical protein
LEDFENETRYAEYQSFTVGDADSKYRLDINGYSGDAGLFTKRSQSIGIGVSPENISAVSFVQF